MPTFELFDGIKIDCYSADHLPPHIHAINGEHEALIDIRELKVYAGYLPAKQLKKAMKYVRDHQEDLLETFYALNEPLRPNVKSTPDT